VKAFIVEAPEFTAGGFAEDGRVTKVAPIIGYMEGWTAQEVKDYCDENGWVCRRAMLNTGDGKIVGTEALKEADG